MGLARKRCFRLNVSIEAALRDGTATYIDEGLETPAGSCTCIVSALMALIPSDGEARALFDRGSDGPFS